MNIKKLLGKRIQEIRKSRNLTQESLAELVGMDTSSISHIENGKYYPNAENFEKIMEVLNVKPNEIFDYTSYADTDTLISEMYSSMKSNDKLTRLMYKFYSSIKFTG